MTPELLCITARWVRGMAAKPRMESNQVMMFCVRRGQCAQSIYFGISAGIVVAVVLCSSLAKESAAQSTVVIGGSGQPTVEVNLEVLDGQNGHFPESSRKLRLPGGQSAGIVQLRVPSTAKSTEASTTAPRLSFQRPAGPEQLRVPQQTTRTRLALPAPKVVQHMAQRSAAPKVSAGMDSQTANPTPSRSEGSSANRQVSSMSTASRTPSSTTAPRLSLQRPAGPEQLRVPQQTTRTRLALPAPKVVQHMAQRSAAPKVSAGMDSQTANPTPSRSEGSSANRQVSSMSAASRTPSATTAKPESGEQKIASLPRVNFPRDGGQILRIDFLGASTRLTPDAKRSLASLAATMAESDGRLQLKAYAGGTVETLSSARRLSLSRALAVRSFLIEKRIRSTRIDVRALGRAEDSGPPERVDIVLLTQ